MKGSSCFGRVFVRSGSIAQRSCCSCESAKTSNTSAFASSGRLTHITARSHFLRITSPGRVLYHLHISTYSLIGAARSSLPYSRFAGTTLK